MELKSTPMGQRLAQHPYNRVKLLNAGIEVSGEKHQYLIPFNELIDIYCKRGIVWGELEFLLPNDKVVRLHGTDWEETQQFYRYLLQTWQKWSQEMSEISAQVLEKQIRFINDVINLNQWIKRSRLKDIQQAIQESFSAIPLPLERLIQFDNCRELYQRCLQWLQQGDTLIDEENSCWTTRMLNQYAEFFNTIESSPLNESQCRAVINGENNTLVLAGAGSGKTSVLVARVGWLLRRELAQPDQILLLAFGRKAAEEINERISERLNVDITAKTFHALALSIIQQSTKKQPKISSLETDNKKRRSLLLEEWRNQCQQKKAQAKGWREWLSQELAWDIPEGEFWHDKKLENQVAVRLERWISLLRMQGGSQKEIIESVQPEFTDTFKKHLKLLAPLLKAWKAALKEEGAIDFSGLLHQAISFIEKGRFINPWKHILVDEFQDISPLRARLLMALKQQNKQTALFVVGDDWQAIYRFSGAELLLTTAFHRQFGEGAEYALDTTYRFNDIIGQVANEFIQQNPIQLSKPLNSLVKGNKKSVVLLPDDQLENLLNKMSGYVTEDETILLLARYYYLQPELLKKAQTRWPKLNLQFMTFHASKGQQADYVIILGLQEGKDGFPAPARESIIEVALLPKIEDYPNAEERRLMYVALTRAKKQVWLLFNKQQPSCFVVELKAQGVPIQKKP
ncbi:DNA helicase IV [Proteus hauseri ATCC 700826]|uniref:DNA 3'-5' helicase n=1 Tax=Proteus hauseri ATCC 700826 TaxID=1354271 RepID=A0AAJ3HT09_PROHU|nr:DNA helicase IV [Proteus hauseri]OAT47478.1 DNA helicase IV [Proteus hauseri ATCC 700826]